VNYGLYLSATGVMTSSHSVDVIANNLANAETSGFKRQLAIFQQRDPEAVEDPSTRDQGDRFFDTVGGGQLLAPSNFDQSAGDPEQTDRNLDLLINGGGYFMVQDAKGQTRLTRNGNFMADRKGNLVLSSDATTHVLDQQRKPITIDPSINPGEIAVSDNGTLNVGKDQSVGKIGLFDVADPSLLRPVGGTLFKVPASVRVTDATAAQVQSGFLERSNVDPAMELTRMMEAQRTLEANANMIRYQDQSMGRLVTDVGRIG
jgi:flagellar basal-body rod protein FlgF